MPVSGKPGLTSTDMENRCAWPIVSAVISGTMVSERAVATGKVLVGPGDASGPDIGVGADGPPRPRILTQTQRRLGGANTWPGSKPAARNRCLIDPIIGSRGSVEQSAFHGAALGHDRPGRERAAQYAALTVRRRVSLEAFGEVHRLGSAGPGRQGREQSLTS
jgi:hypothetical protein